METGEPRSSSGLSGEVRPSDFRPCAGRDHGETRLISVVIPHVAGLRETDAALDRCVASLRGYHELIVIVNDGWGFARATNLGLSMTRGDFICVVNNDTELRRGSLLELCDPAAVVAPRMTPQHRDTRPRAFYCMPRHVYELVGPYDEQFTVGYFEDDDMIRRFMAAGVPFRTKPSVEVYHLHGGGTTMSQMGPNEAMSVNRQRFVDKWGEAALFP